MQRLDQLKTALFIDTASIDQMKQYSSKLPLAGITTNPSLLKQAGVLNYRDYIRKVVSLFPNLSLSFEVLSDDFETMYREAVRISSFGENIYVKIPIVNTQGETTETVLSRLSEQGIKINVTTLFTENQAQLAIKSLCPKTPCYLSLFAGRIADTGRDPLPILKSVLSDIEKQPHWKLLWASPREILNLFQANQMGCDIITMTPQLLGKLTNIGKDLEQFSIETVTGFYSDIKKSQLAFA